MALARYSLCASNCLPRERSSVSPLSARRKNSQQGAPVSVQLEKEMSSLEMDREVIRCKTCVLVQYRTGTGNCRRCVRALPQRLEFLIPPPAPPEEAAAEPAMEKFVNQETVENIGQRIRQLRESRSMTQSQLQSRSKVSRSYLSRIESGQMTPSLGTLEKISEALNVGFNPLFIPESEGEALMEAPFIQGLGRFLRQLDWEQWQSILKRWQERPQALDEGIFQQRYAVGFRDEDPVQADVERLGDLLQCAEAGRHLAALDAGEVGARDFGARLQLALGHAARFAQLANALADILDRLLVDELFRGWFSGCFLRRCRWRNQELQTLGQGAHATAAISRARPGLGQTTSLTANDFPIQL